MSFDEDSGNGDNGNGGSDDGSDGDGGIGHETVEKGDKPDGETRDS